MLNRSLPPDAGALGGGYTHMLTYRIVEDN